MSVTLDPSVGLLFFCTCSVVGFVFGYLARQVAAESGGADSGQPGK
jgi:hypothetical protein